MNFQENRFAIILGSVTALVAGLLIFWGIKSGGAYAEAKTNYQIASSTINRLMRQPIKPTPENLRAKSAAVASYEQSVSELQQTFDPLRRPTLANIAPSDYTDRLLETRQRLRAEFEKAGAMLPDPFFAGHQKYSDTLPPRKDTGVLTFELTAFEDLLVRLAQAGPDSLDNVYWPGIPEVPEEARAVAHPIELTFTGSEGSLRRFLEALVTAEDHYFVVRTMRVRNDRTSAPNAQDARFPETAGAEPEAAAGDDVFGGFFDEEQPAEGAADAAAEDNDGGAPEPARVQEEAREGSEILKQVLGDETIHVFMRIDVMQFLEPIEP